MEDFKRKKKRGRSRIFRSCFPSTAGERPFSYDKSYRGNTKNGRLGKPAMMAVSGRNGRDFMPDVNLVNGGVTVKGADGYNNRSSHRRFISRLLKALLFDSLMVKKIHKSSSKSPIDSTKIEPYLSIENTGKSSDGTESTDTLDSSTLFSNLLSSSSGSTSSSSSTNSNSRCSSDPKTSSPTDSVDFRHQNSSKSSTSEKPNRINSNSRSYSVKKDIHRLDSTNYRNSVSSDAPPARKLKSVKIKSGFHNWNIRLCMFLLLSLVVLLVYGRIYSILCTSTWFYFLPRRRIKRVNSVSTAVKFPDTESHQYKKRVIMAGLLDRARNPLR